MKHKEYPSPKLAKIIPYTLNDRICPTARELVTLFGCFPRLLYISSFIHKSKPQKGPLVKIKKSKWGGLSYSPEERT